MNKIQVAVINEACDTPAGMMMFLANLTQKGHTIKSMSDLENLYIKSIENHKSARAVARMPHGTIKRFSPVTIAIVGASRRFLAQARTHQVGLDFVSASLQYSDYSDDAGFVVPYSMFGEDMKYARELYLGSCNNAMINYKHLIAGSSPFMSGTGPSVDNDAAGYAAPQGLRNILVIQGNHQAWGQFIRTRGCKRNTNETAYIAWLIWEALMGTTDGFDLNCWSGPDCVYGSCREGKMSCSEPITLKLSTNGIQEVSDYIDDNWPLIRLW